MAASLPHQLSDLRVNDRDDDAMTSSDDGRDDNDQCESVIAVLCVGYKARCCISKVSLIAEI